MWEPYEVAEWLSTLLLREKYSDSVIGNQIDGASLQEILDQDEWATFGFTVPTDILKIKGGMKKLIT